jgi:hypothetical protein
LQTFDEHLLSIQAHRSPSRDAGHLNRLANLRSLILVEYIRQPL